MNPLVDTIVLIYLLSFFCEPSTLITYMYYSPIYQIKLQAETASTSTDWDLTYNYTKTVSFMNDRTTYYDSSTFNSGYQDYLEVGACSK